jgi:hypothetical protein
MAKHKRKLLSAALILAMLLSVSVPGLGASVYAAGEPGDGVLITSADDAPDTGSGGTEAPGEQEDIDDSGESGILEESETTETFEVTTAPVPFGIMASATAAAEPIFTANAVVDEDEGTVTFNFYVENNPGMFFFYLTTDYPNNILTYSRFDKPDFFNDTQADADANKINDILLQNSDSDIFYDDGKFLSLIFNINENADAGDYWLDLSEASFFMMKMIRCMSIQ